MKFNLFPFFSILIIASFISCKKIDMLLDELRDHQHKLKYEAESFYYKDKNGNTVEVFRKEFDQSTGEVSKITVKFNSEIPVGIFSGGFTKSFLVRSAKPYVYLIADNSPLDTAMFVLLDSTGQMVNARVTKNYYSYLTSLDCFNGPTHVYLIGNYASVSGRVGGTVLLNFFHFVYDQNDNLIWIDTANPASIAEYKYDSTKKVNPQIYADEGWDGSWNSVLIGQYMGWLHGLQPKYKRVHGSIMKDGIRQEYDITDHQYDSHNNLVSYKTDHATQYFITWKAVQ